MLTRFIAWCLLLASALSASAQWSTNWPAVSNAWWAWRGLSSNVNEGINERSVTISGSDWASYDKYTNIAWVSRAMLSAMASEIESVCVNFVNVGDTRGTNATYDVWFQATTNMPLSWTTTGLISAVSADTSIYWAAEDAGGWDYFAFKYGETLDEFKAAVNLLSEVVATNGGTYGVIWNSDDTTSNSVSRFGSSQVSWAAAVSAAESNISYSAPLASAQAVDYTTGDWRPYPDNTYEALARKRYSKVMVTIPSAGTNYHSSFDIYAFTIPPGIGGTSEWAANGSSFEDGLYTFVESGQVTNAAIRRSGFIGSVAKTNIGEWAAEPAQDEAGASNSKGWVTLISGGGRNSPIAVIDYAVTNGFQYVP